MVFHIIDAMTDGFSRTTERNGLVFVAIFAVLALLNAFVAPVETGTTVGVTLTAGLVGFLTGLLSLAIGLATMATAIVALRTFASDETETISREFRRRKIATATLNAFVGTIVFVSLVAAGSVFLLVPGLFLLVSLYYWSAFVAIEDQNFVRAFRSSWALTRGSRLRLFGLGIAVLVLGLAVNATVAIPTFLLGGTAGLVLTQVVAAAVTVYIIATTARAYDQLRGLEPPVEADSRPESAGMAA
ncbi:hypothetical protein HYG81_06885 [Natrinema zhouii]|uniref:DUF7847 domain-containing protein n=1 Tax=Natrinema zhouii TaxID=1710539 RepID=A0A7D6GLK6_9EURY|nr:hypothetical protein [Natrinema zhouii]QLK27319.1 hypothetical protein HYG81_06885 [Natrinema zhouii]